MVSEQTVVRLTLGEMWDPWTFIFIRSTDAGHKGKPQVIALTSKYPAKLGLHGAQGHC